ncbi:MAG: sulfite exporter TauE/SafE family protein [Chloroflexi bacterium]|nr:sulfite exporter TauE/SafE family protein [Chloroflexota bacterium]
MDLLIGLVIGVAAGFLSGLMGIGGGMVLVPALTLVLGTEQHLAQGVSLAVVAVTATIGAILHYRHGNVDPSTTMSVAPVAILFGFVGAFVAGGLDSTTLSRIFGVVILLMALWMLFGARNPAA